MTRKRRCHFIDPGFSLEFTPYLIRGKNDNRVHRWIASAMPGGFLAMTIVSSPNNPGFPLEFTPYLIRGRNDNGKFTFSATPTGFPRAQE